MSIHRRAVPREQIEEMIAYLAEKYPATFFTDRRQKRPLKKNLIIDLEKDGVLDDERRSAALNFYCRDWNYENTLLAGAERIDLDGKKAGVVTEAEQHEAQNRLRVARQELRERKAREQGAIPIVQELHRARQIPTDALNKIDAPPQPARQIPTDAFNNINAFPQPTIPVSRSAIRVPPEFQRLYTLVRDVEVVLTQTEDDALRSMLATTTLGLLSTEAQNIAKMLGSQT